VSVIATATNTVTGSPIPVGSFPFGVAVTPDGSEVYVANSGDGTASVVSTATNTVTGSPIPVGRFTEAFGVFIQPPARFAGTPGTASCVGESVSTAVQQHGGLIGAAKALGFPNIRALVKAAWEFCEFCNFDQQSAGQSVCDSFLRQ
jgi:YVTN family beta-propeller protein